MRIAVEIVGSVEEVDAQGSRGLLLPDVLRVEKARVERDLRWRGSRPVLEVCVSSFRL